MRYLIIKIVKNISKNGFKRDIWLVDNLINKWYV